MKELLEEAVRAFNDLPNMKYDGKRYKTTYDLASAIDNYLKVKQDIDEYSSKMFTQLKLDYGDTNIQG